MFNVLFLRSFRENLPILFRTGMWGTQRLTKVTWIPVWVIITRPVTPAINRSGGKPIWLVEGFSKQFMPLGWLLTLTSGLLIRNISGLYHVYTYDSKLPLPKTPQSWGRYKGPAQLIIVTHKRGTCSYIPWAPLPHCLPPIPSSGKCFGLRRPSTRDLKTCFHRLDFGYDISNFFQVT